MISNVFNIFWIRSYFHFLRCTCFSKTFRGFFRHLVSCKIIVLFRQVFLLGMVLCRWNVMYLMPVRFLSTHLVYFAVLSCANYFFYFVWQVFLSGVVLWGWNLIYFTAVRLLSAHLVSSAIWSYRIYLFISANVLIGRGVVGLEYNIFHVCSAAFRTPGFFGILVFCKLTFLFWQVFLSGVVLWG